MDICCCKTARKLPPPSQDEGLLLGFFRKFYVPFLFHWLTRVVVVSGREGQQGDLMPPRVGGAWQCLGREGLLSLDPCPWSLEGSGAHPGPGVEAGVGRVIAEIQVGPTLECFLQDPVQTQTGELLGGRPSLDASGELLGGRPSLDASLPRCCSSWLCLERVSISCATSMWAWISSWLCPRWVPSLPSPLSPRL